MHVARPLCPMAQSGAESVPLGAVAASTSQIVSSQAKELVVNAPAAADEPSRLTIVEANAALAASRPHRRFVVLWRWRDRMLVLVV